MYNNLFMLSYFYNFSKTASLHGHSQIAEYLISKGADVNIQNHDGYTPLMNGNF